LSCICRSKLENNKNYNASEENEFKSILTFL
jgi:hypothetical protein